MMSTKHHLMWNIGLSETDTVRLASFLGDGYMLKSFSPDVLPTPEELETDDPHIIWVAASAKEQLFAHPAQMRQHLELVPRALVLDAHYSKDELEQALDCNFADIVRKPLMRTSILKVVRRAIEARNVYTDIMRMTREIWLEREMLTRKNDVLSFLVTFLTKTSESLAVEDIVANARDSLKMLLPVHEIHAIAWPGIASNTCDAELFIAAESRTAAHVAWTDLLLESARRLACGTIKGYRATSLETATPGVAPEQGRTMLLPLGNGKDTVGAIALAMTSEPTLGRDQAQALDSAMRHLTLALRNAFAYRDIRLQADHDALTQLHNRRSFDLRILEEIERHKRYGLPLSLLMLDIDHFKQVNDTYGHLAGDETLRQLANTLRNTCRGTDFMARYGGEEFVVILPHTDISQAEILAERLRMAISANSTEHEGRNIAITSSIGIATLEPGMIATPSSLIATADAALYLAKAKGRNMVCTPACSGVSLAAGTK